MNEDWKEFTKKAKENYHRIGAIPCPAFDNTLVHFNKYGFKHLLRKERKYRDRNEQLRRLDLLKFAPMIIRTSSTFSNYIVKKIETTTNTKISSAEFWSLVYKDNDRTIRVILRKMNNGHLHFFSIMDHLD